MYIHPCTCAQFCPTLVAPWTVVCQVPLSVGFSRRGCWSGLPFPSPGDLPNPWIESGSPVLQADSLLSEPPGKFLKRMGKLPEIQIWSKRNSHGEFVCVLITAGRDTSKHHSLCLLNT